MKKVLLLIIFSFSFFFVNNVVNAETELSSGDVIIGYTKFDENTWISASRAAKAGSLYTKEAGDIFVRTFIYIDEDVWYEMDSEFGGYYLLEGEELENVKENLKIYYYNNEPIKMIYDITELVVNHDYLINEFEISNITHEYVSYDEVEQTFTCPYGDAFVFDLSFVDAEMRNVTQKYVGECGENIKFTEYGMYSTSELKIDYIQMATSESENNNQGKFVEAEYMLNENNNEHYYTIKTLGELNEYSPYPYESSRKWIGFTVNFSAYNVGYNYDVYSSGLDFYVEYETDHMNIYIDTESFDSRLHNNRIIIMDNKYNKQEYININYLPFNEDLSIDYVADGEINYISGVYKNHEENTFELVESSNGNQQIFYYEGKMYINKNLEYGSSFYFTDNGVLKSLDSYTNSQNDEIVIMGIYDIHYLRYTKWNDGGNSGGYAMSTNSFNNFYESVKNNHYTYPPNATEVIEYFFDGEVPVEEQTKIDYLAGFTDKFTFKDTSDVFYK